MTQKSAENMPEFPKLRLVEPQWVDYQGQPHLYLHDSMGFADQTILIPQGLVPLLSLLDGTRNVEGIQSGFLLRTGIRLQAEVVNDIINQLNTGLLLENGAFVEASAKALQEYRDALHRPMSHAGLVYPENPDELSSTLNDYGNGLPELDEQSIHDGDLVGMLCPHIDYERGHKTYAELWQRAAPSLDDIELAIVFGTDHSGGLGMLTPTRQSYATPFGVLPTDTELVNGLADVIGQEDAYQEEMHHIREHSIELASVWFHHALRGRTCQVLPILCGSFHNFIVGNDNPQEDDKITSVLQYLKDATKGRKTLVMAAGDLAHIGPAFGDAQPLDTIARAKLTAEDTESIEDICKGDAESFLERSRKEQDRRRICGLSPIYMTLKMMNGNVVGESMGYDQCPADQQNGSVVSIAGALLYKSD